MYVFYSLLFWSKISIKYDQNMADFVGLCSKEGADTSTISVIQSVDDELWRIASFRLSHKLHSLQCIVENNAAKVGLNIL